MDWDANDHFDDVVRQFFGQSGVRTRKRREENEGFVESEEEDRVMDIVETKKGTHIIVELPGFSAKDISVSVKEKRLEILAKKQSAGKVQDYLAARLQLGITIKKRLPNHIDTKKMNHTYKNGILEVSF